MFNNFHFHIRLSTFEDPQFSLTRICLKLKKYNQTHYSADANDLFLCVVKKMCGWSIRLVVLISVFILSSKVRFSRERKVKVWFLKKNSEIVNLIVFHLTLAMEATESLIFFVDCGIVAIPLSHISFWQVVALHLDWKVASTMWQNKNSVITG